MPKQLIVRPGQTGRIAAYGADSVAELVISLLRDKTWVPLLVDGNVVLGQCTGFNIDDIAVCILHAAGLETEWKEEKIIDPLSPARAREDRHLEKLLSVRHHPGDRGAPSKPIHITLAGLATFPGYLAVRARERREQYRH